MFRSERSPLRRRSRLISMRSRRASTPWNPLRQLHGSSFGDGLDVEIMQGFAKRLGVRYKLVYSDFYNVIRDLLGKDVVRRDGHASLTGEFPIKGDVVATGFYGPSVATGDSDLFRTDVSVAGSACRALGFMIHPIQEGATLSMDIANTKQLIGSRSLLVVERTCLDPANSGLTGVGVDLKAYARARISMNWFPRCSQRGGTTHPPRRSGRRARSAGMGRTDQGARAGLRSSDSRGGFSRRRGQLA